MPKPDPIADAMTLFAFQAAEVEAGLRLHAREQLDALRTLLETTAETIPFDRPIELGHQVGRALTSGLEAIADEMQRQLGEYAVQAGRALPRFLSRAVGGVRREQNLPDADSFDPDEVESDGGDLLAFLGIDDDRLRAILLLLLWNGLTVRQQWLVFIQRWELTVFQRVSAAAAQAQSMQVAVPPRTSGPDIQRGPQAPDPDATRFAMRRAARLAIANALESGSRVGDLRRAVDGLVTTQAQQVLNEVIKQTTAVNADEFVGHVWSAILDDRTCSYCRRQDGKFYPLDAAGNATIPPIPAHGWCRCVATPATRRGKVGEQSFPEWFARQPERFRRRVLGRQFGAKLRFADYPAFRKMVPVHVRPMKDAT